MKKYIAKNLLYLRRLKGWQQADIQDRLGIKASTWSMYENDNSQPTLDTLIHISNFFGITESDLIRKDLSTETHLIDLHKNGKNHHSNTAKDTSFDTPKPKKTTKKTSQYNFEMPFNQSLNEDKTPLTMEERMAAFIAEMQRNEAKNAERIAELEGKINDLVKSSRKK